MRKPGQGAGQSQYQPLLSHAPRSDEQTSARLQGHELGLDKKQLPGGARSSRIAKNRYKRELLIRCQRRRIHCTNEKIDTPPSYAYEKTRLVQAGLSSFDATESLLRISVSERASLPVWHPLSPVPAVSSPQRELRGCPQDSM